jgi:hypothetical protein
MGERLGPTAQHEGYRSFSDRNLPSSGGLDEARLFGTSRLVVIRGLRVGIKQPSLQFRRTDSDPGITQLRAHVREAAVSWSDKHTSHRSDPAGAADVAR